MFVASGCELLMEVLENAWTFYVCSFLHGLHKDNADAIVVDNKKVFVPLLDITGNRLVSLVTIYFFRLMILVKTVLER